MSVTTLEPTDTVTMTDEEFEVAMTTLDQIIIDIQANLRKAGEIFGRMSNFQLKKAKAKYKGFFGSKDRIERLALAGRGIMSWHLAEPEQSIKAAHFKLLRAHVRAIVNDPAAVVQVATLTGVRTKLLRDMTPTEFYAVIHPVDGIVPPDKQIKTVTCPTQKKIDQAALEADVFADLKVTSDRRHVVIFGDSKDGKVKHASKIVIPFKTLKKLLG